MVRRAVVTSFDENYLMPGLLAAVSALENSPEDVMLAILGVDLSSESVALIEEKTPGNRTVILHAADLTGGMPEWEHISSAAWARVGMASLLPDEVERVVYVDGDSFTRGSLESLFELDLEGRTIGACIDRPMPTHRARHEWGREEDPRHDYGADSPVPDVFAYFNTGMLVIDLNAWKEREVERRVMSIAADLPSSYFLLDQDAMNQVLSDDWFLLDWRKWNWPGFLKAPEAWDAHVIHFISSPKPWVSQPMGAPFAREYRRAARSIGWDFDAATERRKSGLIELVTPYSLVVRRKRISRRIRGGSRSDTESISPADTVIAGGRPTRGLVVAFDEAYLNPGLVAATTALENSPSDVRLFVLGVDLSDRSQERISAVVGPDRLVMVDAHEYTHGFPGLMPQAAWARIGIDELLPANLGRVLYLDSDTLTRADLSPLFDINLEGRVLAAAIEEPDPTHRRRHEWGRTVDPSLDFLADSPVPDVAAYFNSGVLAIDIPQWRENDVGKRLLDLAESLPPSFILPDQDLLNVVLWREWLPLDWRRWNWPGLMLDRLSWEAHIAHFKGPTKPWVSNPLGAPFAREYRLAAHRVGWDLDADVHRIPRGLAEAVLPYSLVLRRRKLSRALRRLRP